MEWLSHYRSAAARRLLALLNSSMGEEAALVLPLEADSLRSVAAVAPSAVACMRHR